MKLYFSAKISSFLLCMIILTSTLFTVHAQNGCTNSYASNYDPTATVNDWSCVFIAANGWEFIQTNLYSYASYDFGVTFDGNTAADGSVLGAFVENESGELQCVGFEILDSDPFSIGWINVYEDNYDTPDVDGAIQGQELIYLYWDVNTQEEYLAIPLDGPATQTYFSDVTLILEGFEVYSTSMVEGCTDVVALNYSQQSNVDDGTCIYSDATCAGGQELVSVVIDEGYYPEEVAWYIQSDGVTQENGVGSAQVCITPGCYSIIVSEYYDEFGWGFSEGPFPHADVYVYVEGTLVYESTFNYLTQTDPPQDLFVSVGTDCQPIIDSMDTSLSGYNWDVTVTGGNQTIFIPSGTDLSVDSVTISEGSVLGVFFLNSDGEYQCAGNVLVNEEGFQISVYADDTTTPEIDGFQEGVPFWFVVYDPQTGLDMEVDAIFSSGDNLFNLNGISVISGFQPKMAVITQQSIELPAGFYAFSTYMSPENKNIEDVLAGIHDQIIVVKDNVGHAYLPLWGFDGIGELIDGQGYQIKTTSACSFTVGGSYLRSEENPVALTEGWNLIAYLSLDPINTTDVFDAMIADGNLVIVKDYAGNVYLPEWEFNSIGDMVPGQAYQLKVHNAAVLQY